MGPPDSTNVAEQPRDSGTNKSKGKQKSETSKSKKAAKPTLLEKKRSTPEKSEEQESPRKMLKRAASARGMKEKPIRLSDKADRIEIKEKRAEEEVIALSLTSGKDGDRPNRRLNDFVLHNSDGVPQPLEMLEIEDMYISGLVMPLEATSDKEKERGVRCEGFGRIEGWDISGYEEGSPVIWLSTDIADYDCIKPASTYRNYYEHFFEKARACIEVYNKLTKSAGGDPDCSLDELLAGVVRSMSGSKSFSGMQSIKEFVISQGEFIYNQLVGLDDSSKDDQKFADLSALLSLKEESKKCIDFPKENTISNKSLSIGSGNLGDTETNSPDVEDDDARIARLLQETENFKTSKQRKTLDSASNKFYIKINEDEIASDYPLPAFYKTPNQETDEFLVFDNDLDIYHPDDLPRSMLHNWALYNTDSRLISLELLPMKPCSDMDVVIFGSGVMTADDGSGFFLDSDPNQSTSSGTQNVDGMPIYLSAIKEWTIELGPSMIFVTIRTDMAWYRLGKPSKQYAPWYEPVVKTARLAVAIITILKEQSRVARLSFADVIKKVSELGKENLAYISSKPDAVERYVVVHGQIILQLFAEFPDNEIRRCAFLTGLTRNMELKHHTKWLMKKKKILEKGGKNFNPRSSSQPLTSKRKAMQATTTRLVNRIWGEYYSNYSPEDSKEETPSELKEEEEEENEEQDEMLEEDDAEEEISLVTENTMKVSPISIPTGPCLNEGEVRWDGDPLGSKDSGNVLYKQAFVCGDVIAVGKSVLMEADGSDKFPPIYFVEYMFETPDGEKMFHGRLLQYGSLTVLGSTANQREVFLTNECTTFNLEKIKQILAVDFQRIPWGHQHRKDNWNTFKLDRARAEERQKKGLPIEYYCKSLYWPEKGAFFSLPYDSLGLGTGVCNSCNIKEVEMEKEGFRVNSSNKGFFYRGTEFSLNDFMYASAYCFAEQNVDTETFKGGRNIGLRAYVVCQLLEIIVPKESRQADVESTQVKVRRFFRPEDISPEKAYHSDIREIYYSEDIRYLSVEAIEGKCIVRKKHEVASDYSPALLQHVFFCERLYDPCKGSLKQLPAQIKIKYSNANVNSNSPSGGKRGKGTFKDTENQKDDENRLATLDIFAGCGGLSEGLDKSGVSTTRWAIEYEEPAGEAFRLNHPESYVFIHNCNVLLRAVMEKCGDMDECISTTEAAELAAKLDEQDIKNLPLPGQVDFINGGPPCQGFSGMNRFNQSTWSKVQCEMILAFLSFADYYRPKYFLLENVRNFVSFNKGQTFRLTLASLLEMGYQVRFGILEAGAFGVSQSRKRVFLWAASPEATLPEWPQPMHVFGVPDLKIKLSDNLGYVAAPSTADGAPFRAITVRDTIGDLPVVRNGAAEVKSEYQTDPVSWFQKKIRGDMSVLTDHISKEMNELNLIRCQRIPKRPGADWRDLPSIKVTLSSGEVADLIPWCLPNTADRHNQWKGLFGRLDWEGNFPTSITDPQPMGKVGMCFHPDQDRIVTVRECARSQGFPDSYKFAGTIQHKHRQIGNAVPPPLAYALGIKLKEAWKSKRS